MDEQKLDQSGGSIFEAYFAEDDIDNMVTVHEDGRIEISGVMTGQEAITRLLDCSTQPIVFESLSRSALCPPPLNRCRPTTHQKIRRTSIVCGLALTIFRSDGVMRTHEYS